MTTKRSRKIVHIKNKNNVELFIEIISIVHQPHLTGETEEISG